MAALLGKLEQNTSISTGGDGGRRRMTTEGSSTLASLTSSVHAAVANSESFRVTCATPRSVFKFVNFYALGFIVPVKLKTRAIESTSGNVSHVAASGLYVLVGVLAFLSAMFVGVRFYAWSRRRSRQPFGPRASAFDCCAIFLPWLVCSAMFAVLLVLSDFCVGADQTVTAIIGKLETKGKIDPAGAELLTFYVNCDPDDFDGIAAPDVIAANGDGVVSAVAEALQLVVKVAGTLRTLITSDRLISIGATSASAAEIVSTKDEITSHIITIGHTILGNGAVEPAGTNTTTYTEGVLGMLQCASLNRVYSNAMSELCNDTFTPLHTMFGALMASAVITVLLALLFRVRFMDPSGRRGRPSEVSRNSVSVDAYELGSVLSDTGLQSTLTLNAVLSADGKQLSGLGGSTSDDENSADGWDGDDMPLLR